jgi:hypothetical protein
MLFYKFFYKAFEIAVLISVAVLLAIFVLKMIVDLFALIITFFFALFFTRHTLNKRMNAVLSIMGIILYLASWPATHAWGVLPGMLFWAPGILLWISAVYLSFPKHPMTAAHPATNEQDEENVPAEIGFAIGEPITYIPIAVSGGKIVESERRQSCLEDDVFDIWSNADGPLVHRLFIPKEMCTFEKPVTCVAIGLRGKEKDPRNNDTSFRWNDGGSYYGGEGGFIERFCRFLSDRKIKSVKGPDESMFPGTTGSYWGYFTMEDAAEIERWLFKHDASRSELDILFPEGCPS